MRKCKTCGALLTEGPLVDRRGKSSVGQCELKSVPTLKCSSHCDELYWYWPDFGCELLDAVSPSQGCVAKRGWSLWKARHLCRDCRQELSHDPQPRRLTFEIQLTNGRSMSMTLTTALLCCAACNRHFLPSQGSKHDPFYDAIADLIGVVATDELQRS